MTTFDDAYMRANADALRAEDWHAITDFRACQRLTSDERDNLATFVATPRPELIRYGARLETPPCGPPSTTTSAPSPGWMTHRTRRWRITPRSSSFGSSSRPAFGSGSASSPGPRAASPPISGARLLARGLAFAGLAWAVLWRMGAQ